MAPPLGLRTGRRVLGRRAVLAQPWHDCPVSFEPRRNLRPRVATRSKWARIEALLRNRAFAAEYADSRARWRDGVPAVFSPGTGGRLRTQTRLREHGVYKVGDQPCHNVIEIGRTVFVGHAVEDLRIEIVGTEKDTFDPHDWIGKHARVVCDPADHWFGDDGPRSGSITPEDVGPWRVGYRIVRGRQ